MLTLKRLVSVLFLLLGTCWICIGRARAQDDPLTFVIVSPAGPDIPFFQPIISGMEDACAQLEAQCHWLSDPFVSLEDMEGYFEDALAMNPDGIGTIAFEPEIIRSGVEQAVARGIPVITFNTDDPNANKDDALPLLFYIGPDMVGSGVSNAQRVLAEAEADGATVEAAICTNQQPDVQTFTDYCNGAGSVFAEAGVPFEQLPITDDPGVAAREIAAYLEESPQVNAVLVSGPGPALALVDAMREAGLGPGDLYAAGRDAVPEVLQMIEDGFLVQTIGQQPYLQGYQTIMSLYVASQYGMRPSGHIYTNIVIDRDNVDQATEQVAQGYW
jgi:simple sugar transport system substrate-binding protein